ncbi:MAG: CrcB family protein, partial [Nocardioidaceae bacterium]
MSEPVPAGSDHRRGDDPGLVAVLVAVALGGAAGATVRHLLAGVLPGGGAAFPWPTFAVNVSGCLLLALLAGLSAEGRRPLLAALLGTGALGGYTTLSTYAEQARSLAAA